MKLSGPQIESLRDALLSAFPSQGNLAQMVRFHLEENLDAIAEGQNHTERVFNLINWVEAHGQLPELIIGAATNNPGNTELQSWIKKNVADSVNQFISEKKPSPEKPWNLNDFGFSVAQWLGEGKPKRSILILSAKLAESRSISSIPISRPTNCWSSASNWLWSQNGTWSCGIS